jgi:electron transfer flavoprotein alpha/beta subunit
VKIVCLVKQIPRPDAIEFDQETKTLKREGVPLELNPFDGYAVSEAVRLREAHGGEVVAMTMGPPQAEEALRECLALGADRCIHLSDRAFAVADTIGTSRTLALAVAKEGADLVLCGRKTLDSETWQVPPEVAAFLRRPQVTNVVGLELVDGRLRARRETNEGEEVREVGLPAVCSIARTNAQISAASSEASSDGRIDLWTASDLVSDVRPNDKRFGQTGSPTRVLAVRDVTPERAGATAASPEDAAARIATRLAEVGTPPSAWEKPERLGEQPAASYDCWTLVEPVAGRASRTSLELLGKGRELAGKLGGRNVALVLGHGISGAVADAGRYGAEAVYAFDDATLADGDTDAWVAVLRHVLERERPHVLLIPATPHGRDVGPRVAGELELGMTGDCVDLGIDRAGRLIQHKPAYGGNIVSVIMGATTPQLATVRPRMFEPVKPRDGDGVEVHQLRVETVPEARTRLVERHRDDPPPFALDEADVVVGVGEAVGDDVAKVGELVRPLRGAVGGDRAASAAGLVPPSRHIGLLGRAVAPRLYLAVEASGDFEHATGTVKAGVIASLGENGPRADVVLPGDWRETLPTLVAALADQI